MKQHLKELPITARLSLLVAALLLFTIGITINNALTRQEKRTRAASPPACSPRPSCLDTTPKCEITEPSTGWCPTNSPKSFTNQK